MTSQTCHSIATNLSAYRDGELPVVDHVAVRQHLRECAACRAELDALEDLGTTLRMRLEYAAVDSDHLRGLASDVVGRVLAEQQQSWPARARHAFDDMHLVWAGLCATAGVVMCAGLAAALVLLAPRAERGDSMRGIVATMSSPGTNLEPLALAAGVQAPRVSAEAIMPVMLATAWPTADDEIEMAFAAVVTREGRVAKTTPLEGTSNEQFARSLRANARFQPASRAGSPVAVSLVWLVNHTTVRPLAADLIKPQSSRADPADVTT